MAVPLVLLADRTVHGQALTQVQALFSGLHQQADQIAPERVVTAAVAYLLPRVRLDDQIACVQA
jgi:hypothetical protein